MSERLQDEIAKRVDEGVRRADAERRSWSFALGYVVVVVAFVLSPAVPGAERIFGALTVAQAAAAYAPGAIAAVIANVLYRRRGSGDPLYEGAELVESALQYSSVLACLFLAGSASSPLWVPCPFTIAFWATMKPFHVRRYALVLLVSHGGLALAFAARGQRVDVAITVAAALTLLALLLAASHRERQTTRLEADRDLERERLAAALLDAERRRMRSEMWHGVGHELAVMVQEMEAAARAGSVAATRALAAARAALVDLGGMARDDDDGPAARSLAALAHLLDAKCRPLASTAAVEVAVAEGAGSAAIDGATARAWLHVAPELVRNALVHGGARHVHVELGCGDGLVMTVRDDGVGLTAERFVQATGGIQNARAWLADVGGRVEQQPPLPPWATELRVTLPTSSR